MKNMKMKQKKKKYQDKKNVTCTNRIFEILSTKGSFRLIPENFLMFHGILIKDLFDKQDNKYDGVFRDYNISKKEDILDAKSLVCSDFRKIKNTLEYDMRTEREINYKLLIKNEIVDNISFFASRIWQASFYRGKYKKHCSFYRKIFESTWF